MCAATAGLALPIEAHENFLSFSWPLLLKDDLLQNSTLARSSTARRCSPVLPDTLLIARGDRKANDAISRCRTDSVLQVDPHRSSPSCGNTQAARDLQKEKKGREAANEAKSKVLCLLSSAALILSPT